MSSASRPAGCSCFTFSRGTLFTAFTIARAKLSQSRDFSSEEEMSRLLFANSTPMSRRVKSIPSTPPRRRIARRTRSSCSLSNGSLIVIPPSGKEPANNGSREVFPRPSPEVAPLLLAPAPVFIPVHSPGASPSCRVPSCSPPAGSPRPGAGSLGRRPRPRRIRARKSTAALATHPTRITPPFHPEARAGTTLFR
jgi:hypothetical protein